LEPGQVLVMEPVLERELRPKIGWAYQVKWDGIRMLSFIHPHQVQLQTKGGRVRWGQFQELNALSCLTKDKPLILDGELVALHEGRAEFTLILKRNWGNHDHIPIWYMIFDILMYQGEDLRQRPLAERQEIITSLKLPGPRFVPVENFVDGEALLSKTKELNWEGIVAKDLQSPYVPGKSSHWEKRKNILQEKLVVVGYIEKDGQLASLLLAKDFGQGLQYAGAVGSGFASNQRRKLLGVLPQIKLDSPNWGLKKKPGWNWLKPILQAEVQFSEWTPEMVVRAPVFKSLWMGEKRIELS